MRAMMGWALRSNRSDPGGGAMAWALCCLLIILAGYFVSVSLFWNSDWSNDTMDQYRQAMSGQFEDHHPPVMAWTWQPLVLAGHAKAIIAVQAALYWMAAFIVLLTGQLKRPVAIVLFILPTSTALIGVIWKDSQIAIAWGLGFSLLLLARRMPRYKLPWILLAITCFLYGAAVRHNGFLAVPPLLLAAVLGRPWLSRAWSTALVYGAIAIAVFIAMIAINSQLTHGKSPRTAQLSLPIFDLAAITATTGENAFPFPMTAPQRTQIAGCYHPNAWDWMYMDNSPCRWTMARMQAFEHGGSSINLAWLAGIASHPAAYFQHRLNYSSHFFCFYPCRTDVYRASFNQQPSRLSEFYVLVTKPRQFSPYLALIGCFLVSIAALRLRSDNAGLIVAAGAAGALNLLSYIPFGVASDGRYAYPSFVLFAFATAALLLSRTNPASQSAAQLHGPGTSPQSSAK